MFENLPLVLSNLKVAKDMITTIQDLRDFAKINEATIELRERLIEIGERVLAEQEQLLTLQTKISDIEKENNRLKDWSAEKGNYSWRQIADGVSAYIENDFKGNFQDVRKFCCNCFDKTIKSTLQQKKIAVGRQIALVCPNGCPELIFNNYKNS